MPKIRIHGSGDIWSWEYCQILIEVAKQMPDKKFWLYTRSYVIPTLLPGIIELASQPNVDVNLSADYTNYEECLEVFESSPHFNLIACQQERDAIWVNWLAQRLPRNKIVVFPEHSRLDLKAEPVKDGLTCPAMMGAFQTKPIACLQCSNICVK